MKYKSIQIDNISFDTYLCLKKIQVEFVKESNFSGIYISTKVRGMIFTSRKSCVFSSDLVFPLKNLLKIAGAIVMSWVIGWLTGRASISHHKYTLTVFCTPDEK